MVAALAALAGASGDADAIKISNSASSGQQAGSATHRSEVDVRKILLPGEGRGDYITVDVPGRRLYVTHTARVHILNLDTLAPVGEIAGLKAAHGVAIDHHSGHGFVTDGDQNAIVMFDLATGKAIKTIPSQGKKPDSIAFDNVTRRVFAFNSESATAVVIEPASGKVVGSVKTPEGPEFSLADGKGNIFVNIDAANAIARIDAKSMKLVRLMKLSGCDGPAPLAYDAADNIFFTGCGNGVMDVVDGGTGRTISTIKVGSDPDGIVFDPQRKRVVVANRDASWTIIRQSGRNRYHVEKTLKIDEYAKTLGLDPTTHRLFSSTADLIWPKRESGKKYLPTAKSGTFRLLVVAGSGN